MLEAFGRFKISVTQYLISTQMLFGTCSFIIKLKTVDSIFRGVNSQVMVSLSCWLSILQYIKDKTKGTGSLTFFNFAVAFLLQKCLWAVVKVRNDKCEVKTLLVAKRKRKEMKNPRASRFWLPNARNLHRYPWGNEIQECIWKYCITLWSTIEYEC